MALDLIHELLSVNQYLAVHLHGRQFSPPRFAIDRIRMKMEQLCRVVDIKKPFKELPGTHRATSFHVKAESYFA
jgi:hypothetical protein